MKQNKSSKKKRSKNKKQVKDAMYYLNTITNSMLLLVLLIFAALINVFILWNNQENESLFLFIFIALITYSQNKNLIFVLGCPLVIVNILMVLKKAFRYEGFSDLTKGPTNPDQLKYICESTFLGGKAQKDVSDCMMAFNHDSTFSDSEFTDYLISHLYDEGFEISDNEYNRFIDGDLSVNHGDYIYNKIYDSSKAKGNNWNVTFSTTTTVPTPVTVKYSDLINDFIDIKRLERLKIDQLLVPCKEIIEKGDTDYGFNVPCQALLDDQDDDTD
uniref:Uncharacterized protein n=1 Tax=viral metagenome TaxID=1070528 RepID=A0A6C0KNJ4_9ZZZZ